MNASNSPGKYYAELLRRPTWLMLLTTIRAATDRPTFTAVPGSRIHGRYNSSMRALKKRGWADNTRYTHGPDVWALTDAGRLALARAEVETGRSW